MSALADALGPFRARPADAAVALDFDGTLSAIVDDPAAARPVPGAAEALAAVAARYGLVAVLSGRPVEFLQGHVPPGVVLSGLYGLEVVRDGTRVDHPDAAAWRAVVADAARTSTVDGPAGMDVETKGLSLTLHYRARPELAPAVLAWAVEEAARTGLDLREAKMSVELHPPIPADKGTALQALAGDRDAV